MKHPVVKSGFTRVLIGRGQASSSRRPFPNDLRFYVSLWDFFYLEESPQRFEFKYKTWKIVCTLYLARLQNFYYLNFHYSFWNCICLFFLWDEKKYTRRFLHISWNLRPHNSLKFQMEKKLKCQVEIQKKIKLCLLTKNIHRVKTINLRIKNREKWNKVLQAATSPDKTTLQKLSPFYNT